MLRSTKVYEETKITLEELKDHLRLKSEADVIAYLIQHYNDKWGSITNLMDKKYREEIKRLRDEYLTEARKVRSAPPKIGAPGRAPTGRGPGPRSRGERGNI